MVPVVPVRDAGKGQGTESGAGLQNCGVWEEAKVAVRRVARLQQHTIDVVVLEEVLVATVEDGRVRCVVHHVRAQRDSAAIDAEARRVGALEYAKVMHVVILKDGVRTAERLAVAAFQTTGVDSDAPPSHGLSAKPSICM